MTTPVDPPNSPEPAAWRQRTGGACRIGDGVIAPDCRQAYAALYPGRGDNEFDDSFSSSYGREGRAMSSGTTHLQPQIDLFSD
jgi:hypothetical protein